MDPPSFDDADDLLLALGSDDSRATERAGGNPSRSSIYQ
jgi:hypothetical protein